MMPAFLRRVLLLFLWGACSPAQTPAPVVPAPDPAPPAGEAPEPPPAPKPFDLSAFFNEVDRADLSAAPADLPLVFKAGAKEVRFVDRLIKADDDFARGRFGEVITSLESLVSEMPDNKGVRMQLAGAYIQTARYADAERLLNELIAEFPGDYALVNNLAWMYARATDPKFRRPGLAVEKARAALLIAPGDHHVWSTLSASYYADGQYERALSAAEQAHFQAQKAGRQADLFAYARQIEECALAVQAMSILE